MLRVRVTTKRKNAGNQSGNDSRKKSQKRLPRGKGAMASSFFLKRGCRCNQRGVGRGRDSKICGRAVGDDIQGKFDVSGYRRQQISVLQA